MFRNLTLTSIFWLALGLGLFVCGGYFGYGRRMYPFALGLFFLGSGSVLCGITNGFTDYSRNGRLLWKIGAVVLLLGILLTGYGGYRFV
ncbi:MAG: hypothetical protein ACR2LT_00945 [Pyrinomonadaceae bacterium]